jgi:hypothetical protein
VKGSTEARRFVLSDVGYAPDSGSKADIAGWPSRVMSVDFGPFAGCLLTSRQRVESRCGAVALG